MDRAQHVKSIEAGVRNLHSLLLLHKPRQREEREYYKLVLYNHLLKLYYIGLSSE